LIVEVGKHKAERPRFDVGRHHLDDIPAATISAIIGNIRRLRHRCDSSTFGTASANQV
jgi:hypothetical protein